jgi:hypothetical protein
VHLFVAVALADEPPPPPPPPPTEAEEPAEGEVIRIQVTDDLGSALDDFADKSAVYRLEDPERIEDFAGEDLLPKPFRIRGRFYGKPLLAVTGLGGRAAMRIGAAAGHRWWQLGDSFVVVGGETRLEASAPVGGARGYTFALGHFAGPWVGPVGVRIGPDLRADRAVWGDETLPATLALGPQLTLSLDAKVAQAFVGVEPAWYLAGERAPVDWSASPLPGVGDDTTWMAGVAVPVGIFHWMAQGSAQATPLGSVWEAGLGVHFQPF